MDALRDLTNMFHYMEGQIEALKNSNKKLQEELYDAKEALRLAQRAAEREQARGQWCVCDGSGEYVAYRYDGAKPPEMARMTCPVSQHAMVPQRPAAPAPAQVRENPNAPVPARVDLNNEKGRASGDDDLDAILDATFGYPKRAKNTQVERDRELVNLLNHLATHQCPVQ